MRRRAEIVVLTGPSRAGKTTVCRSVIAATRSRHLTVGGVLTQDATDDRGAGLQIVCDLLSGERRLLARARAGRDAAARPGLSEPSGPADPNGSSGSPTVSGPSGPPDASELRWEFDAQGVAFGRRALRAAATPGCDVLVVDQIGPLDCATSAGGRACSISSAKGVSISPCSSSTRALSRSS